jgi:hypothetical protein
MAKQENEFLYGLARFAVTVLLLGLLILWLSATKLVAMGYGRRAVPRVTI